PAVAALLGSGDRPCRPVAGQTGLAASCAQQRAAPFVHRQAQQPVRGVNTAVPDHSQIECEINVPSDGRDQYEAWVRSMIGLSVTAQGVYVDDTGERDKSELHPLDIVVAEVDAPQVPGNWIDV